VIGDPLAFWVAGVVEFPPQVLQILPGGEPGPVRPVEVSRKPLLGLQVHIGDDEMQLRAVVIPVLYPDGRDSVAVHAGNQEVPLEAVDQLQPGSGPSCEHGRILLGKA